VDAEKLLMPEGAAALLPFVSKTQFPDSWHCSTAKCDGRVML
jgi:hypothetical protein